MGVSSSTIEVREMAEPKELRRQAALEQGALVVAIARAGGSMTFSE